MADSDFVPSAKAADTLGVSQQEVRRLVGSGVLRGSMVANRVMVDRVSLELRTRQKVTAGARCTPANAWAMLRLVTGDDVVLLDRVIRSRLRAALRQVTAERLVEVTARRAVVHHYRVRDQYLARLLVEQGVVRAGLSAVEHDPEFNLVSLDAVVVDLYCEEQTHQRLRREYGLVPGDTLSKVTLRVVDDLDRVRPGPSGHQVRNGPAMIEPGRAGAVTAAICADLMGNLDTRAAVAVRHPVGTFLSPSCPLRGCTPGASPIWTARATTPGRVARPRHDRCSDRCSGRCVIDVVPTPAFTHRSTHRPLLPAHTPSTADTDRCSALSPPGPRVSRRSSGPAARRRRV